MLRFRLRLAKYDYVAHHIPGKLLYAADALSRAPSREEGDQELQEEVEAYVDHVTVPSIPATPQRLQVYKLLKLKILNARGLESTVNLNGQGNTPWRVH